ncbi:MetQ/NlpA family ABC transporter substrate-binding protein [Enterococcus quebecensis]|uniref:Lipoprotein n=1 Tax=Enterococcus quebecensis TaxID=903983 RepID=A0A1E5GUK8_9ENTE|nr:MetQ/NlpA family ABC transporter substrate-binding protein [Enterococcus quebecensis]OEG16373.1 methionine ABC transporter substrate-binding protein [Enterococcus quebecensis]OJG72756.1 YaeC family lipoprotein [Enterococcus quebecensis]
MKKKLIGFAAVVALTLGLAACGGSTKKDDTVLKVGASPTPHAEILEQVKPILKKEGIDLEIVKFSDYILPNKSLAEGEIDANYFQHIQYFNEQVKDNGYKFANAGKIHIELMGLYSKKIKDIKELKDGATIITSNSKSDWGRIITILQDAGLVEVKSGVNLATATFDDIEKNPKNLKFVHDVNPELLATTYQNEEGDLVAINANFAYQAGLEPKEDAVLIEKENSPFANIIAVREEDKDKESVKKLVSALQSKEIQDWILEKWNGSITPVK